MIDHDCGTGRCAGCEERELRESLTSAVRAIAHGPTNGPTGLELLAIAVSGNGDDGNLASAVRDAGESIGSGLHAVAYAIKELT